MTDFNVCDRVVYSARFLRSMGVSATDEKWHDSGTIFGIADGWLATVWWNNKQKVSTINVANLNHIERTVTAEEPPFECGDAWNGMGFRPSH